MYDSNYKIKTYNSECFADLSGLVINKFEQYL